MLDYRANKLFLIVFGIPWFVLRWVAILGFPFLYYGIGLALADNRFLQILISLISLFVGELIWNFVVIYIDKFFMFLFNLFVDVIPAEGRNKEEANMVVKGGHQAIRMLNLTKNHPSSWTDDDLACFKSGIFTFFFMDNVEKRIALIKSYYKEHPEEFAGMQSVENLLIKKSLQVGWLERLVCNPQLRGCAISYSLMSYLLLFNPAS